MGRHFRRNVAHAMIVLDHFAKWQVRIRWEQLLIAGMDEFYAPGALADFQFGSVGTRNTKIYAVKMFGLPDFQTSITVIHEFFGKFKGHFDALSHANVGVRGACVTRD